MKSLAFLVAVELEKGENSGGTTTTTTIIVIIIIIVK